MSKPLQKTMDINPELEAYRVRLTDGWAERILKLPKSDSKLHSILFDVVADLRSVTVTAGMPYQLVSQIPEFYKGLAGSSLEPDSTTKLAGIITYKLGTRLALDVLTLQKIRAACLEIGAEIESASTSASQIVSKAMTPEAVWTDYMAETGFQFGLWGAQRICFVAAYNAYESFLLRCLRVALKQPTFRKKSEEKFCECLRIHFGQKVVDECWLAPELKNAQLARHSLSHYGGRLTSELKQAGCKYAVNDDVIQIKASDNTALLRMLETAIIKVATAANAISQFDG